MLNAIFSHLVRISYYSGRRLIRSRLMGSFGPKLHFNTYCLYIVHSLIVFIQLMLSVLVWPKAVPLNGGFCIIVSCFIFKRIQPRLRNGTLVLAFFFLSILLFFLSIYLFVNNVFMHWVKGIGNGPTKCGCFAFLGQMSSYYCFYFYLF